MADRVPCLEIISVPSGPYPEEVRKALVGLRLPFGRDPEDAVLLDRYPALAQTVLDILNYYNPTAAIVLALWLQQHPKVATLFFDTKACKLEENTPSFTEKTAPQLKYL